jgi:glycosyltransferase involved in cell wall biosynthesis
MDISIVVPLFNEEDSVEPLFRGIVDVLTSLDREAEVIFVDDGSSKVSSKLRTNSCNGCWH